MRCVGIFLIYKCRKPDLPYLQQTNIFKITSFMNYFNILFKFNDFMDQKTIDNSIVIKYSIISGCAVDA